MCKSTFRIRNLHGSIEKRKPSSLWVARDKCVFALLLQSLAEPWGNTISIYFSVPFPNWIGKGTKDRELRQSFTFSKALSNKGLPGNMPDICACLNNVRNMSYTLFSFLAGIRFYSHLIEADLIMSQGGGVILTLFPIKWRIRWNIFPL